jgi:RNA polymerase sigma factor (TIGR02999 family)
MSDAGVPPGSVTLILDAVRAGDAAARDRLFELVYRELRGMARRQRRAVGGGETLNTTALVHETYLKLAGEARWSTKDRAHFFALAARAMRQILIDQARAHARQKRGKGERPLRLDDGPLDVAAPARADELIALDAALDRLAEVDPEMARIVEWRFFAGLSVVDIAGVLEVSDRTIKRHWRAARAFLLQELEAQGVRT